MENNINKCSVGLEEGVRCLEYYAFRESFENNISGDISLKVDRERNIKLEYDGSQEEFVNIVKNGHGRLIAYIDNDDKLLNEIRAKRRKIRKMERKIKILFASSISSVATILYILYECFNSY